MNDTSGGVEDLLPRPKDESQAGLGESDAAVGGGAGGTGE
jgi:hypothetical protein